MGKPIMNELFRRRHGRDPITGDTYELDFGRLKYQYEWGRWHDLSKITEGKLSASDLISTHESVER